MSNDPAMIWPADWVKPSPVYVPGEQQYYPGEGMLWYGRENEPTKADYAALDAALESQGHGEYSIDKLTLVGRYHPKWTTACDEKVDTPKSSRDGGYGSPTYEMQNIFPGASLTEEPIWIHGKDGSLEKIVPPNSGLYWMDLNQMAWAGAEPKSVADEYIGDEKLYFDRVAGMWKVPCDEVGPVE